MKNFFYIKLYKYSNKQKTEVYLNRLLVIGFLKKWFKFKFFYYFNIMKNTTKQKRKRRITPRVNKKGIKVTGRRNYNTLGKMFSTIKRMMSTNQDLNENKIK